MKELEILNFITSVKLTENNEYINLPLSVEVDRLPLMFNMKINFNLLGTKIDKTYYLKLDMIDIDSKKVETKFFEGVNLLNIPWGVKLEDERMATALNIENITNVITSKGDYYLELIFEDEQGNQITKAKQFLKVY